MIISNPRVGQHRLRPYESFIAMFLGRKLAVTRKVVYMMQSCLEARRPERPRKDNQAPPAISCSIIKNQTNPSRKLTRKVHLRPEGLPFFALPSALSKPDLCKRRLALVMPWHASAMIRERNVSEAPL